MDMDNVTASRITLMQDQFSVTSQRPIHTGMAEALLGCLVVFLDWRRAGNESTRER